MSKSSKKILYISPGYFHAREELFINLAKEFRIKVIYVSHKAKNGIPSEKFKNLVNFEIWAFKSAKLREIRFLGGFKLFYKLFNELRINHYDLVISSTQHTLHSKIVYILRNFFHYKLVLVNEIWEYPVTKNILQFIWREAAKYILMKCDYVFCQGKKSLYFARSLGIKEENCFIFPLMCENLATKDIRKHVYLDSQFQKYQGFIKFGYIGRFIEQKGLLYLIEAFKNVSEQYKNIVLFLIGDGELRQIIKDRITEANRIVLINWINPRYLPFVYSNLDCFVLPSFYDGFSTVTSEAASMGLPLIVTHMVGGASDLVEDGENGYIIDSKNVAQLEDAIIKVIKKGKAGRERMGSVSRDKYQKLNDYNIHRMVINKILGKINATS